MVSISVLISSHSKAYDLWHITEYFFSKYWYKCTYPIYLGANGEKYLDLCPKSWSYLHVGKDISWSKSLIDYLNQIDTKYVLLFLDDFILLQNVNEEKIKSLLLFAEKENAVMIRCVPNPKGNLHVDENFDRIDVLSKVPYITSLQVALWNKEFLINLLKYDFNPWEFETKAGKTKEALKYWDKFFVSKENIFNYTHYVEKGKFYPMIKKLGQDNKVTFDFSHRKFLSKKELNKIKGTFLKTFLVNLIPHKFQSKIRKILQKNEL